MVEYTVYVANDGEEFDSAQECLDWEYKISHLPASIHWYTEDGISLIPKSESDMLSMYNSDSFTHCVVDNIPSWPEDLEFMRSYWGFVMPARPGDFYWDKRMGWEEP